MPTVVIIGAGLAGLTSAQALQKQGWDVTVVDTNAAPALGTSFANAGMLTPSMADPWNAPGLLPYLLKSIGHENSSFLLRMGALPSFASWGLRFLAQSRSSEYLKSCEANFHLARYSLQKISEWSEKLELQFEQRDNGTMKIFRHAKDLKTPLKVAKQLTPLGLQCEQLSPTQATAFEPSLAPIENQLSAALLYPQDASGNAYRFCNALSETLMKQGVTLRYNEPFKRWLWHGNKLSGFATQQQSYTPDAIVLAAGVASPKLLQPLGLELMVRPVKGYSISLDAHGLEGLPQLPIIDEALHCAISPFDSILRVAGTAELSGWNTEIKPARIENLREMVRAILPEQAELLLTKETAAWTGLRPMSADGLPYIGSCKRPQLEKLYLNTGHGHLGWTHSAGSAELLAAEMQSKPGDITIKPYQASRVLNRA